MLTKDKSAEHAAMHTSRRVNQAIHRQTEDNVRRYSGNDDAIHARLQKLEREWDLDRAMFVVAPAGLFTSFALAATVDRRFSRLSLVIGFGLLSYALLGWAPPVSILRGLGFRTRYEIDHERYALKLLRGDFTHLPPHRTADGRGPVAQVLHAVRT